MYIYVCVKHVYDDYNDQENCQKTLLLVMGVIHWPQTLTSKQPWNKCTLPCLTVRYRWV